MKELSENDINYQIEEAMRQAQIEILNNNTLHPEDAITNKLTDRFYQLEWGRNFPILKLQNVYFKQEEIYLSDLDNPEEKENLILEFIEKTKNVNNFELFDYINQRWKLLIGLGLVSVGQPFITKPKSGSTFGALGSGKGTSPASLTFRKLIHEKYRLRINGKQIKIFGTPKIGGILGRSVPYLGWALMYWDVGEMLHEMNTEFWENHYDEYDFSLLMNNYS
ncbi:hypothetical protein O2K51_07980 [Apibacter raozihei]|uniref:hypothetical protein n=1 Tax=Apibacter raozihei TaxID=2500547 RepID=UPI000FE2C3D8|nr:hypothetical protein [Apibacter raozihei]